MRLRSKWYGALLAYGLLSEPAWSATYYVDGNAGNDSGSGSLAQPKKTIQAGLSLLSSTGGDVLVIAPGQYAGASNAINGIGRSQTSVWNTVRAASAGSVRITAPLDLPAQDHHLQFEGLWFDATTQKTITGRFAKFLRCGFRGGPATGNQVNVAIGTNNVTPGAEQILLEDAYVYGAGGRYGVLVYNANQIVLRRVLVRHGDGWSDTVGDPQANVSIYDSSNVLTQNLLLLDSHPSGYFEAALYHPSNGTTATHSNNIRHVGAIIVNVTNNAVGFDGGVAAAGIRMDDSVIWNVDYALSSNGSAHQAALSGLTVGAAPSGGINDWRSGGNLAVTRSILTQFGGSNFSAVTHSGNVCFQPACSGELSINPFSSGLRYLPRIEAGSALLTAGPGGTRVGAQVLTRLGVSGTSYGEIGYEQDTGNALWPWPNEEVIRLALCNDEGVTTGFCAEASLTRYIWGMLGNGIPAEIYGATLVFGDSFESQ